MEKRFQFRHVNELTGLFVLAVLLLAAGGLYIAARSQQWFSAKAEYLLELPAEGAYGLKPGDDVVMLGMPAGTVRDVHVSEDGGLRAHITLRRDFAGFVTTDSEAVIKKVFGVAGDSYVELSRGTGLPLKPEGEVLPCQSSEELPTMMDRLVAEVRAEVLPVARKVSAFLDEWSRLGSNLNLAQTELHQALARLNQLTASLEQGKGSAGRLLTDATLVERGESVLARSEQALTNLQTVLRQLQEGTVLLPEIAEHLRQGTVRLPAISQAVEAETRDLPGLILQIHQAANELQRLTEAIQRHWLVRKYVEPRGGGGRIPPEQVPGGTP